MNAQEFLKHWKQGEESGCLTCQDGKLLSPGWKCDICNRINGNMSSLNVKSAYGIAAQAISFMSSSKCIKCGTQFVGTPENPPVNALCKYCEIEKLKADNAELRTQNESLRTKLAEVLLGELLYICPSCDSDLKVLPSDSVVTCPECKKRITISFDADFVNGMWQDRTSLCVEDCCPVCHGTNIGTEGTPCPRCGEN